ncbi:HIV Tat-specific factor 1, partial [Trichonephila clavipes]
HNPEGVVAVTFATPEMADECINLMNGRWFASRQLTAETWDGKTKYKVAETEEHRMKRLHAWEKFLEEKGTASKNSLQNMKASASNSNLNSSQNDYELAGATDSSGDSDSDRFNSCQEIYSQFGLAIHQNDHQARRRFVEWAQNEIAVVPDFHKRILFSDEAHFWLNGYVNKQNCRIWSEANPQVYVETPLHPEN